jgi:hypothetical protein
MMRMAGGAVVVYDLSQWVPSVPLTDLQRRNSLRTDFYRWGPSLGNRSYGGVTRVCKNMYDEQNKQGSTVFR